jgi:hypothetical protein
MASPMQVLGNILKGRAPDYSRLTYPDFDCLKNNTDLRTTQQKEQYETAYFHRQNFINSGGKQA